MPSHETRVFATEARLTRAVQATSMTEDQLLERAESLSADPSVLEEYKPWFFGARISTNALDSWGTEMDTTSLQNFARDARAGVSVLDSHNIEHVIGKSIDGRYVSDGAVIGTHTGQDDATERTESVFMILAGQRTATGMMTDDYINQLRVSAYKDISIGFTLPPDAHVRCNLCGKNMFEWATDEGCWHFPGIRMTIETDEGRRTVYVTGRVVNAGLSEYSPVYDGATPGAEVVPFAVAKAYDMEDADALDRVTANRLTERYRVRFRKAERPIFAIGGHQEDDGMGSMRKRTGNSILRDQNDGQDHTDSTEVPADTQVQDDATSGAEAVTEQNPAPPAEGEDTLTAFPDEPDEDDLEDEDDATPDPDPVDEHDGTEGDQPAERLTKAQIDIYNARYADTGIRFGADAVDALVQRVTQLGTDLRTARAELKKLQPEVEMGRRYRDMLIDQVVTEAARAHPGAASEFDETKLRARLTRSSTTIEDLEEWRDEYRDLANARFSNLPHLRPVDGDEKPPTDTRGGRKKPGRLIQHGDDTTEQAG